MWYFTQKVGFPKALWDAIEREAELEGVHPAKWIRDTLSDVLGGRPSNQPQDRRESRHAVSYSCTCERCQALRPPFLGPRP
jgi:hypothetical protein